MPVYYMPISVVVDGHEVEFEGRFQFDEFGTVESIEPDHRIDLVLELMAERAFPERRQNELDDMECEQDEPPEQKLSSPF